MSIGAPYVASRMLLGMPKLTLAELCNNVRKAAGYGDDRQMTAFASLLGIKPASLHNLESGRTRKLGKALQGYIKVGANPEYLLYERGLPMLKDVEKSRRAQTLVAKIIRLDDSKLAAVEHMIDSSPLARNRRTENAMKMPPPRLLTLIAISRAQRRARQTLKAQARWTMTVQWVGPPKANTRLVERKPDI